MRLRFQKRCFAPQINEENETAFDFFVFLTFLSFCLFDFLAGLNFFGNNVILATYLLDGVANLLVMVKNNSLTYPFAISLLCGKFTLENQQC